MRLAASGSASPAFPARLVRSLDIIPFHTRNKRLAIPPQCAHALTITARIVAFIGDEIATCAPAQFQKGVRYVCTSQT